ncbi:MAG: carbamoyltransferase HypF [Planctomycetia bacterium]|nr:carbamoyltransferase HypF [Planctomycetia bacterium]
MVRRRLTVWGIVQGVGFRPFVYQLAVRHGLTGYVGNDSAGVIVEVQGEAEQVERFVQDLSAHSPPLARVHRVESIERPAIPETVFTIRPSQTTTDRSSSIPADIATCADCLRELFDPTDRRYRYPFINCCHCGPRFTIIRSLPYDRPATTLAGFALCADCEREYHDPANRRFHAQPIACPACGPKVWLESDDATRIERDDAIRTAVRVLDGGGILAVKGIGGFHLACDATNACAVARLRERKGRMDKPFAVLVKDVDMAKRFAAINDDHAAVLTGPERPIVMLERHPGQGGVIDGVAPGLRTIGLMLPYSPLHHLLLGDRPLVMTSGNRSDEPIARDNTEARERLGELADAFLMHDRDIHSACDDSVIRVFAGREYPIRRSRGYAPLPVKLPRSGKSVLAVGGELKATLCVTSGDRAYLGQHLGDVESPDTLAALDRAAEHLLDLFRIAPDRIACDRHPGYRSADWAQRFAERRGIPLVRVQHHHAHVASLLVDANVNGTPVLVVCLDGTGYGTDGSIWGGEFFLADGDRIERVGHLKYVPLPGGDAAIRRPYRVALAHLCAAGLPWDDDLPCVAACPPTERTFLRQQLQRNVNCVPTSSMGRLFDAVASLLGVRHVVNFEGQAAMELEALVDEDAEAYPFATTGVDPLVLDPRPLLAAIVADLRTRVPVRLIASRFHVTIAEMIRDIAFRLNAPIVGLTGGVFQNVTLHNLVFHRLQADGRTMLTHRQVPCNDGGLSLGQAVIAGGIR